VSEPAPSRSGVLARIEDYSLVALVGVLVVLAGLQIVLRLGFESGIVWADALLRHLVLWTALLGAMTAAREDKHLAIDAISRYLPPRRRGALRLLTHGVAAVVSALLCWYSVGLVRLEMDAGGVAFGSVPSWVGETIMPVAFAVITWRFARHAWNGLSIALGRIAAPGEAPAP